MSYKTFRKHTKLRFAFTVGMSMAMFVAQLSAGIPFGIQDARAVISYEQEGFRFREDDGSETTATWIAAQDTDISRARNTNTRLRVLVNTTDDTPSNQYQLEYKKSTDGTYKRVIKELTNPEIGQTSTLTVSTQTSPHTLSSFPIRTGQKLAVLVHAFRATNTNDFTLSATYNGDTMTSAGRATVAENSRRTVSEIFYLNTPAVGSYDIVITSSLDSQAIISAHALDGFSGSIGGTGSNTSGCTAAVTTTQANSLILTASTVRSNTTPPTMTPDGSNNELYELNTGSDNASVVGGGYSLTTTSTGNYTGGSSCSATNADIAFAAEFQFDTVQQPIYLSPSSNIAASGANTSAQLTAPSGKNTGDFVTGRIQDDENPADAINITADDYTELEWSIKATNAAAVDEVYQFRVTVAGTAFNTYTVTPQMTILGPTLTQNDWRIYLNNNAIDPTDPWPNGSLDLGENTALDGAVRANDLLEPSDVVRLRMSITVTVVGLESSEKGFILAYAEASDCTTASSWTDVDAQNGSGTWRFFDSPVTDGSTITTNRLGVSDVSGRVSESDPTSTNPSSVSAGQDLEWDWVIQYNGSVQAKSYCFRIERDDGTALSAYNSDSYPRLETAPGADDLMRHGNFYSTEVEKGLFWTGTNESTTPAFDSQASNATASGSTVTLSSFVVGSNPNRILVCGATNATTQSVTSITWNGASESFTKIDELQAGSGRIELWYLVAPTATTSNIVVTYSAGGFIPKAAGCVSLYNVLQSAPSGHVSYLIDGSVSTVSANLPTNSGDMVIDMIGKISGTGTLTNGSEQTLRWSIESAGGDQGMSTQIATNGTTTMDWVSSSSVTSMGVIAIPLRPN